MGHGWLWPSPKFQTIHLSNLASSFLFKEKEKEFIHQAEYLHIIKYMQCLLSQSASLLYANKTVCASEQLLKMNHCKLFTMGAFKVLFSIASKSKKEKKKLHFWQTNKEVFKQFLKLKQHIVKVSNNMFSTIF